MNNIKYKILIMFCFLCLSCNTNKRKKTLCPYYPYEYNIEYEDERIIISYTDKDIEELYEANGQYYEKGNNILILSTKKDTCFYLKDILRSNYKRIIKKENGEMFVTQTYKIINNEEIPLVFFYYDGKYQIVKISRFTGIDFIQK